MTTEETKKVLSVLRASYPKYYQNMNTHDQANLINVWADIFAEDNGAMVLEAVKGYIRSNSSGYPPVPGQITEIMYKFVNPHEMSEQEAWSLVMNALRNSIYCAEDEFSNLPEQIQRIVGNPRQLREMAMMDTQTLNSVVSSNFQRSYRNVANRDKDFCKLSDNTKTLILEAFNIKAIN